MLKKIPIRGITYFVLLYMIAAFVWWAYHLWCLNDRVFDAKKEALEQRALQQGQTLDTASPPYLLVEREWLKGRRMIRAEGIFFSLCLAFGLIMINRAAAHEVALARQQRNFMLSITHELKSPIAGVRLVFETFCRHKGLPPEQVDKLCANGLRDAGRLQHLVEDLLLAARLEDHWQPLPEPVDISKVTRDLVASLMVRFPQANIKVNTPENLPPVQADKSGLTAVIQNLLENALKYSPEGAPVEFSVEKPNGHLRLRVADQGAGIPDREKQAVFEKFYRIGNEETRQAPGTGLGLYIVQQVVKAHGGRIQINDNVPKGTVFTIDI